MFAFIKRVDELTQYIVEFDLTQHCLKRLHFYAVTRRSYSTCVGKHCYLKNRTRTAVSKLYYTLQKFFLCFHF